MYRTLAIAALGLTLAVPAQAAANLLTNPGFESGTTGWSVTGWQRNPIPTGAPGFLYARSGSGHMGAGCSNALTYVTACVLSQDVATEVGATYSLSFWLRNHVSTGTELYTVRIGDSTFNGSYTLTGWSPIEINGYVATAATTRISFSGRNQTSWLRLDDVSFVRTAAPPVSAPVPEPAAWTLMIAGFGLLGAQLRAARPSRLQPSGK
jgi:hypothetical protein